MATEQPPSDPPWPSRYSRRVIVGVSIGIILLTLTLALWYILHVLLLVFAGVLLAILLRTFADWIREFTKLPENLSLGAALLLLGTVLGTLGWFTVPHVIAQLDVWSEQIPPYLEGLRLQLSQHPMGAWLLEAWPSGPALTARATGMLSSGIGSLFAAVIVVFVGIYLAFDPCLYTNGVLRLVPVAHRPRARDVLAAVGYTLRWWLIGQFAAMSAVGVLTALGLWILGVPLWFTLGLLAFLLDFIPYVGPIIAAVPGILLGFSDSPATGIYVAVLYLVVQQFESLLLVPLIQKRTVLLPPVLTIIAQVLMGLLAGVLGFLLATPLMAVALVTIKMLYVETILGDEITTPVEQIRPEEKPPIPGKSPPEPQGDAAQ